MIVNTYACIFAIIITVKTPIHYKFFATPIVKNTFSLKRQPFGFGCLLFIMHTRTRRNYCFAIVLGAFKKDVPLMILFAKLCDRTLSCLFYLIFILFRTTRVRFRPLFQIFLNEFSFFLCIFFRRCL